MSSNRLLGNRQAFLNQTNQAINIDVDAAKAQFRSSNLTKTTANSDSIIQVIGPDGKLCNIENPHADLQLTEEELDEIFMRPQMNP
jgi:hypothetical protein